jgi:uncharacterized repeat protein (TIGR02543 family)
MKNKKLAMSEYKKQGKKIIVLLCSLLFTMCSLAILFTACDNVTDTPEISEPIENSYGRISISFTEEEEETEKEDTSQTVTSNTARTVLPSTVFDKYVYTFTKTGEGNGVVKTPDNDGFFTLEVGSYTVAVQAYIGTAEPYALAASGVSPQFSVGSGSNAQVIIPLSRITTQVDGKFSYTITYPAGASAVITLQKWPDLNNISLNPVNVTQGNGKTQTFQLGAGSYLFTVLVSKTGFYAGLSEAVHISPLLTTAYIKNFGDDDLIAARIPLSSDYTISGIGTTIYDGNAKTVSVTRKEIASPGAITVYYTGTGSTTYGKSTTAPVNFGTYTVTFDIAAATGFAVAEGLPAGTLIIDNPTPAAGDYTISGIGTFTYDGSTKTASVTRKENASTGAVTVLYNGTATPTPVNAGTYTVTFNVTAATGWNAANGLSAGNIVINKATGATVSATTGASTITGSSITVNAVTAPTNGQTVEYARSMSTTAPTTGYQDSTTFSSLSASTSYYIYSRAKESTNYNAGTANRSAAITTLHVVSSVTANGSTSSKTTTLTFNFSGNPGTITTSNITLSGNASIGSATVSGSGNSRTLSPITLTGTNSTGSVTVTFTATGVVTSSTTVTVYNPLTAGLYAKAPPISGNDTPVNLSSTSGTNIVDQAFNYINANTGTYTLILDSNISVAGHSTAEINNVSATRHLKVTNAKLTIIGMDSERKISVTQGSGYGIFAVGRSGYTGIELTIGNNITLVGTTDTTSDHVVQVQNGAAFTMKDNASMSGNYFYWDDTRAVSVGSSSTFIMQDNAKVTSRGVSGPGSSITMSGSASIAGGVFSGNGSTITMKDNASVTGGVSSVNSSSNFTMQNSASVSGGVSGSGSTFTMSGSASVTGGMSIGSSSTLTMKDDASVSGNTNGSGVSIENNSKFTMQNNAKVFNNYSDGVYVINSGSEFTMSGNASVFGNNRGVNLYNGGSFTMQDSASVYGNSNTSNGGGVYVYRSGTTVTTFTMKNNASVSGNTANNGGGVYVEGYSSSYKASFIMQDNASVSGNTATATGTTSGGGGVYVYNSTFEMKGGLIWGNKATGASSNGGGVYVYNNGTFTMSGGKIYGTDEATVTLRNTSNGSGATLYVNSSGSAKYTSNNTDITTPGTGRDSTITVGTTSAVNVTVTYNINGGTGTTPASQMVSVGSSVTLNNGSGLTRTGYTFGGWNTSPSGTGTNYSASSSYTPVGNITLYAKWDNTLTANTWKDGNILSSNGEQWFRFTATASTQYIHISFGTLTDLYVQLYDSSNNTVGNQTNLYSNTKYISRTLIVGQVYYVKVWPYGSNSGAYKIAFNTSSTAPAQ